MYTPDLGEPLRQRRLARRLSVARLAGRTDVAATACLWRAILEKEGVSCGSVPCPRKPPVPDQADWAECKAFFVREAHAIVLP